ncbi:MAG: hypothetical protein GY847_18200 [Proteobacteria bacterium]|nr:hypothetical protein [Pseudomonadota bacterium]
MRLLPKQRCIGRVPLPEPTSFQAFRTSMAPVPPAKGANFPKTWYTHKNLPVSDKGTMAPSADQARDGSASAAHMKSSESAPRETKEPSAKMEPRSATPPTSESSDTPTLTGSPSIKQGNGAQGNPRADTREKQEKISQNNLDKRAVDQIAGQASGINPTPPLNDNATPNPGQLIWYPS